MKRINYKITALLAILVISTVTVLAFAIEYHKKKQSLVAKKPAQSAIKQPERVYDPVLLEKFERLERELDFSKKHCTYAGVISMVDGKDSANTVRGVKFLFCRADKAFYYKVGNAETIHQEGMNVFIQHEQKRVVLSNPELVIKSPIGSIEALQKILQYEDYDLVGKTAGRKKTLSLLNGTHITCKELSVTYDTISDKLEKIYARLSDFGDPLNKKNDRVLEIDINTLEDKGNLGRYPSASAVLTKTGGKWKLKAKYAEYELIIL